MALWHLTNEHPGTQESVRAAGGVAALVGLLAPGGAAEAHMFAAGALANLCRDSSVGRASVTECGGAAALVGLLAPGGDAIACEAAVWMLSELAGDAQGRDAVLVAGGVAALRGVVARGRPARAQPWAADALRRLGAAPGRRGGRPAAGAQLCSDCARAGRPGC
jgi:hypothetical protein